VARIVLNTFGSLGDLHPYLAIAIELRRRGHAAVLATSEVYRRKILAENVGFAPVRPDVGRLLNDAAFIERLWHPRRGSEFLLREYLVPQVEDSYTDLLEACQGADLLLTHAAALAGPIIAEKLGLPWLSVALQPMLFFSAYDPPVLPGGEWARHLYRFGPRMFQVLMRIGRLRLDRWAEPIHKLRARIGLPPSSVNPLIYGSSPFGTVALFSRALAKPQPDWPPNTSLCGFVFYDELGEMHEAPAENDWELRDFLRAGPPPVLFTLGSSAVMHPGEFFRESITAVHALGVRAVLLAGQRQSEIHNPLPDSIFVAGYVPFSKVMPASAAIVHQGGIGTTAQALRAGRPMLVVPWSHDQPDNAERIRRLGYGRTIPRNSYYAPRVSNELKELLTQPAYSQRTAEAAAQIASEDGVGAASDEIESALRLPLLAH
jgi:UDP:flavonoid glycosyltransferase YjiC (YdhE family)